MKVLKAVESCTKQYRDDYVPMYAERRRWRAEQEKKMMEEAQRVGNKIGMVS